jgi:hypothetical protein
MKGGRKEGRKEGRKDGRKEGKAPLSSIIFFILAP